MKGRKVVLYAFFGLMAVAFYYYFDYRSRSRFDQKDFAARVIPVAGRGAEAVKQAVVGVSIFKAGRLRVVLTRQGKGWAVTAPIKAPAEAWAVDRLLSVLAGLRIQNRIEGVKGNLARFGLGPPAYGVVVRLRDRTRPVRLVVGGKSPDGSLIYAALGSEKDPGAAGDAVFLVDAELLGILGRGPFFFRDKSVVEFDPARVRLISISRGGKEVRLEKTGPSRWRFVRPAGAGRADPEAVEAVVKALAAAQAKAFVGSPADARTGLASPSIRIVLGLSGGGAVNVALGRQTTKGDGYYLRAGGRPEVAVVGLGFFGRVNRGADDLVDRRVVILDAARITAIDLTLADGGRVRFSQNKSVWRVAEPAGSDYCGWQGAWLVARLGRVRYLAKRPAKANPADFDRPLARIVFKTAAGASVSYIFGRVVAPGASARTKGPVLWVKPGGAAEQFLVPATAITNALPKKGCGRGRRPR